MYVNGTQVTQFSTRNNPTQNADLAVNAAQQHFISHSEGYLNAYLADIHLVDGSSLDPTSFGEFDATTGVWNPIEYTGSYGTNGFHLDFKNNSTVAALGTDAAGSNDWTPNNFSVTEGAGNDSLCDSPYNGDTNDDTGLGNEVSGNYCTWNPLATNTTASLSNGNLDYSAGGSNQYAIGTIGVTSGKWYWEVENPGGYWAVGIAKAFGYARTEWYDYVDFWGVEYSGLKVSPPNLRQTYGWSGSVVGVAFDADNGELSFYADGVDKGIAFTGLTSGPYFPSSTTYNGTDTVNFGQRRFNYQAPPGYKTLCTANLPTPTIEDGSAYMDVALYTGNLSTNTISGLGFSPDFVCTKGRTNSSWHYLADIIRGGTKVLSSNSTAAEDTRNNHIQSWNSDGFTLGADGTSNNLNIPMVAWTWDAGSSTVSNTNGSITSTIRASASSGFSIVTWTGTGSSATIGHGLNATPGLILCKDRGSNNWVTQHTSTGQNYMVLNLTAGSNSDSNIWSGASTSSTFSVGSGSNVNGSGRTYVAYCFAQSRATAPWAVMSATAALMARLFIPGSDRLMYYLSRQVRLDTIGL
jgi:hypothetical protein